MMKKLPVWFSMLLVLSTMAFAATQTEQSRATIEGTVSGADSGQALKNARVILRRANSGENSFVSGIPVADISFVENLVGAVATVLTNDNGQFRLTGVEPGRYLISAERDGFVRSEYGQRTPASNGVVVPVSGDQHLMLDVKMVRASVISGRVITPEGEPASQATVVAYAYRYTNGQRSLAEVKSAQTNDLGEYRLFWLPPGEYFIGVTYNELIEGVPVGTMDVSQTSNAAGRGFQGIRVAAVANGSANIVQALGGSVPPIFYPGTIDPDGAIPVRITASTELRGIDFNVTPTRTATLSGRIVAPFPLGQENAIALRGRGAVGPPGNQPVFRFGGPPVQLSLNRVGTAQTGLAGLLNLRLGATPVNADGTFELKGVAPGEYNLTASARDPNGEEYTARTRISVGNTDIANLTLALRPGVEIRGRILLETSPPPQFVMSNLRVSLIPENSVLGGFAGFVANAGGRDNSVLNVQIGAAGEPVQVAEDGSFSLQNVGAMEYRVRVTGLPQGAYVQSGRIDSNDALNAPFSVDQPAAMQLHVGFSAGRVSGAASDERGNPAAGVQAVLVPDPSRRGRSDAYFAATTDQTGQFAFSNVPPGRYKLFAWEEVPPGAYQYPDFIRRFEELGQPVDVNPNGSITTNARVIPAG